MPHAVRVTLRVRSTRRRLERHARSDAARDVRRPVLALVREGLLSNPLYFTPDVKHWVSSLPGPSEHDNTGFGGTSPATPYYCDTQSWTFRSRAVIARRVPRPGRCASLGGVRRSIALSFRN